MTYSTANAWREIMERIFEGFEYRENVSPAWLINPYTGRQLKLDRYYPDLGIAFRFVGLTGPGNRRISEGEAEQEAERNRVRDWLCRRQGVSLIPLDVNEPEPWRIVSRIRSALARTSRLLAQSEVDLSLKRSLAPRLVEARRVCEEILRQVRKDDGLKLYADLWEDRHYAFVADRPAPQAVGSPRRYTPGMKVAHRAFGPGVVVGVEAAGEDSTVTVRFEDGTVRKFLAGLVSQKLTPRS